MSNSLVDVLFLVPCYGDFSKIINTGAGLSQTPYNLTHIDSYMNYVVTMVQVRMYCHTQVFDGTVQYIKWIFSYFPYKSNYSTRFKKILVGDK